MKKRTGSVLSVLLLFCLLSTVAFAETISLRFATLGDPFLEEQVKLFMEENPGIEVEMEVLSAADFNDKVLTMILGGVAPDVGQFLNYLGVQYAQRGQLTPLDSLMPTGYLNDFEPALLTYSKLEGTTYAIPHTNNVQYLMYNTTHLDRAGIVAPTEPEAAWTWSQFKTVLQKTKGANDLEVAYALYGGAPQGRFISIYANGGKIVDIENKKAAINKPEAIAGLEFMNDLLRSDLLTSNFWGTFFDNKLSMGQVNNGATKSGIERLPGEWGVTYLPKESQLTTMVGGETLGIFSETKHPEEAWKLVQFLAHPDNMIAFNVQRNSLPPRRSVQNARTLSQLPPEMADAFLLGLKQAQYGSIQILEEQLLVSWNRIDQEVIRPKVNQLMDGSVSPAVWAETVAQEIQTLLDEMEK